ncbi:UvrD-helicase domain-containing protein [Pontibacillus litoralis]|uniref:DNA 3'-5' helicase n=1 Tax=Pontibacillus litoralis JSM 072002 TaxID=1385512 RepID=A0A0A5G846_9BACI|nr:UvrD-helicase domain-containing protein [Pontibacillus litoralis]KGX88214.1 ATP-dependent DNA helicase UvrD [Pontibacillus litoralis JSM 072002]
MANAMTTFDLVTADDSDASYFRALERSGIWLNKPQLQATRHYEGPALVLAGAGSGKTRVLSSRAGYLLSFHHVDPSDILLLTFTKKAAQEMKERLALLPGLSPSVVRNVTSGTYHSIFLRLLRGQGDARNILSNERQKHVYLKKIMKQLGYKDNYEPESLLAILSHYKNNMVPVEGLPVKTLIDKEVKQILTEYEKVKRNYGYMDFDDILLDCYFLLKQNQRMRQMMQNRFAFVLCDEWQDTNPVQYELIKMIALPQNNLFVVGDDDQTIYEFNGADASIILNFSEQYPETKTYKLDVNYRSSTSIVGLANKVIAFNKKRHDKTLQAVNEAKASPHFLRPNDVNEEAEEIVQQIIRDVKAGDRAYKDYAILYRANSNSRAIYEQFILQEVPFVTYGDKNTFYEQSLVKPVMDHLRLALDGNQMDAVTGILPSLYLNREQTAEFIMRKEMTSPKHNLLAHTLDLPNIKPFQKKHIMERISLLKRLKAMTALEAVREVRKLYDAYVDADKRKNLTMHKEMIKDTLSEIESSASRYKTIADFITFVDEIIEKNKQMDQLRRNNQADVVKLMTIHKSKGLEFPVVYLIGASENVLPHRSALEANAKKDIVVNEQKKTELAIEGERRLAYVAITRAQQSLYISSPRLNQGNQTSISRFIMDVFTDPIKKRQLQYKKPQKKKQKRTGKRVSVRAWECTSNDCIAWKRMDKPEEAKQEWIDCPLCGSVMKQGVREVVER